MIKDGKGSFIIPRLGGGHHYPEIPITLANHLIGAKDFLRVPLIEDLERVENFRPPRGVAPQPRNNEASLSYMYIR